MDYLTIIKCAIIFFPFIALFFTMPFILSQYHKYGSISFFKSSIIYLFIFYFICAYFLVILPLPKISEVAELTTPRTQLIPFSFVLDFIDNTSLNIRDLHTIPLALKESYFYVPVFNIFLTVPFGMFLRYFFKCDMKKTVLYTFLLSLFFELTQLSGLYFIYPRGYRLFDVDDLILNTFGGFLGYIICSPVLKIIPKIDEVNYETKEKGKIISGFRRTLASGLDLFILTIVELFTMFVSKNDFRISIIIVLFYYFVIPLFLHSSTLGERFLNIETLDYENKFNIPRLFVRKILFITIYVIIPLVLWNVAINSGTEIAREISGLVVVLLIFVIYSISGIKYLFTKKEMLYEKWSKTHLVSTIK